ncbi:MAG TPA: alpha/beta hydrolase [Acidothermaceae bacterium]|jgi:pimeloyl-ACP methyl ester carboxylesterase
MTDGMRGDHAGDAHFAYAQAAHYRLVSSESGPPLLLLHGLGGTRDQLARYSTSPQVGSLLAPDLRAHGETMLVGGPDAFHFNGLADDVVALLDRLHYPRTAVVGVSMGAGVAVNLALRYPERISALLLIRPAWTDEPSPVHLSALSHAGDLLQRMGSVVGARVFADSPDYKHVLGASAAAAVSLLEQFRDPKAAQRAVRLVQMPLSNPFKRLADLGALDVPATVVAAPADPLHPVEVAEAWAAHIPGSGWLQTASRDVDPAAYHRDVTASVDRFVASLVPAGGLQRG